MSTPANQFPIEAYTINEFQTAFRIGRTKLYAEIAAGRLKARKLGAKTLIARADAEAWFSSLPTIDDARAA